MKPGDPRALYRDTLLRHSRQPANRGPLRNASHQALARNPLCGDEISVRCRVTEQRIDAIAYETQSCSICLASASMLSQRLDQSACSDATSFAQSFIDALRQPEEPLPCSEGEDLQALVGVKEFKARIRCATLPWEAFLQALESGPKL